MGNAQAQAQAHAYAAWAAWASRQIDIYIYQGAEGVFKMECGGTVQQEAPLTEQYGRAAKVDAVLCDAATHRRRPPPRAAGADARASGYTYCFVPAGGGRGAAGTWNQSGVVTSSCYPTPWTHQVQSRTGDMST